MRNASFKASKIFPVGDIYTNHYVGKSSVFAADGVFAVLVFSNIL